MTTFKRSQAPEQAAFVEGLRKVEPFAAAASVSYFKLHKEPYTEQGEPWHTKPNE